jgi:hypothetical protein
MHRAIAMLAAIAFTTLSVSSACFAHVTDGVRFTLEPTGTPGRVRLELRTGGDRRNNNMSTSLAVSALPGLDAVQLRRGVQAPVRFALVREAGRLDCAGQAARGQALGSCRFTENSAFSDFLAARGMKRPSLNEAYSLTTVGATRGLVESLRANRFPLPTVDEYVAMTAVGVTPDYVSELAAAGYRPDHSRRLIEFAALKVSPSYLAGLARAGYAKLPQHEVIQLAALKIDPEYIRGFEQLGYRNLPVDVLVQMKALDVTPEFVRQLAAQGIKSPSPSQLVQLRAVGFKPGGKRR